MGPDRRAGPDGDGAVPAVPFREDVVQIIAVSPDGKRVFTGDRGATVREWDAEKMAEVRAWRLRGWVTDVALSADGTRLAATGSDGTVWVIDLTTGQVARELGLAGAYGNGVAFAPKRPFLVSTDGDGNVRFWHRDTGQPVGIPMRLTGEVTRPRFRVTAGGGTRGEPAGGSPHNMDEFAVPDGTSVQLSGVPDPPGDLISAGRGFRVRGLDFSPAGDRLAVVDDDGTFELFDPLTGARHQDAARYGRGPLTLRFDPDPARPRALIGTREGIEALAVPAGRKADPVRGSSLLGRVFRVESLVGGGGVYVMGESLVARFDPVGFRQLAVTRPGKTCAPG